MQGWVRGCLIGCGTLTLLVVAGLIGLTVWFRNTLGSPKPPDPAIAQRVALRPVFMRRTGKPWAAGTAFAARLNPGDAPILVTALHLFGTAGGLERELAPAELDQTVRAILLLPFGSRTPVGAAQGALRRTGPTLPADDLDVTNDLAAFKLSPRSKVTALPLAQKDAGFGEWVWLVGDRYDSEPQAQRLFAGRVWGNFEGRMQVRFEQAFPVRGFSGAPVINRRSEVVGILIGANEDRRLGFIHAVGNMRRLLAENGVR